jgi:hypothetical protein
MEGTTGIGSDCLSREPRVAQPGERWKLTGRRLFGSKAISDTLAGRAAEEIDFTRLPSATAPRIAELLKRCLDRNVTTRLRDIGEARVAFVPLTEASASGSGPRCST